MSEVGEADPLRLAPSESVALAKYAVARAGRSGGMAPALPARLRSDREPRLVFVTLGDGRRRGRVFEGYGRGIVAATDRALERAATAGAPADWLVIDVVDEIVSAAEAPTGASDADSSYGLILAPEDFAVLAQEVVAARLVDERGQLQLGRYADLLAWRGRTGAATPTVAARFTTVGASVVDGQTVALDRGSRRFGELTRRGLDDAAEAAGRYLTGAVRRDGRFVYRYWPKSDEDPGAYNVLRHAGTVYSMYELLAHAPDPDLAAAAENARRGLLSFVGPCCAPAPECRCIVEDNIIKLGGNALAILALAMRAEVLNDLEDLPLMKELAGFVIALQQPNGEFHPHLMRASDGAVHPHVSPYYPGEALLALMRLHRLDPTGPWLDAAERGARWLVEVRDGGLSSNEIGQDHWLLYALNEVHRARPRAVFLDYAMAMSRNALATQATDPTKPEVLGSFTPFVGSTPNSTRVEGLNAAYLLARDFGRAEDAAAFRSAIDLALRFVLRHQFRPEMAIYLPNPARTLGGFRSDFVSYEVRIDYVQHAISALLGYERILARDAGDGR